jgi:large subunit ribosomal protein L21
MFAVIRTGGKQYRVASGDVITVEKLAGEVGSSITLGEVLMAGEGGEAKLGDALKGMAVTAEIVEHRLGDKVIVFKKRRRHNYRRKRGHRQPETVLRVTGIGAGA